VLARGVTRRGVGGQIADREDSELHFQPPKLDASACISGSTVDGSILFPFPDGNARVNAATALSAAP